MRLSLGPVVRGEAFFGRQTLIAQILHALSVNNILMVAPRRYGKTSLLMALKERIEKPVVYVDAEALCELAELVSQLVAFTVVIGRPTVSKTISKLFPKSKHDPALLSFKMRESRQVDIKEAWIEAIQSTKETVYYFIDEFSVFLRNTLRFDDSGSHLRDCLNFLRSMRADLRLNAKFLIASETNLFWLLHMHSTGSSMNDLTTISVPPFSQQEAIDFTVAVFEQYHLSYDKGVPEMVAEILSPPIPFYLQLLLSKLAERAAGEHMARITIEDVRTTYHDLLHNPSAFTYFAHYSERLRADFPTQSEAVARSILTCLSKADETTVESSELYRCVCEISSGNIDIADYRDTLLLLEDDHYLHRTSDGRIAMESNLLKDWWRLRYGSLT